MAELASGIAQTALEKLASKAYNEIGLAKSVKEDLNKLERHVRILNSVLGDAEKKQNQKQSEGLRTWLVDLKDLLNDAVDVLDEFDCELLRRQVVKDYGSFGRKVRRFCSRSNPLVFRFSIAHRVKEINERFDEITKEMDQFQLIRSQLNGSEEQSYLSGRGRSDRMTHSFVKASEVIGRDGDKAELISMLMRKDGCDGDDNLSVIPIVGLGGLGKTTVAQSVFNDEKVGGRFDLKLWVCVSLDFDVARLLREILRADHSSLSLDQLQTSVRATLEGKRFLLVLDDVWNEDRAKWLELRQLLTGGAQGSKVIVTTRSETVSTKMTAAPPYKLQGLSDEDSLSLFFKFSLGDEKVAGRNQRLEDIGKEILKKCGGVPLALKALGCLLFNEPEDKWVSIRDSEIWEMEDDQILPALRLSYNAMSSSLKQCFAYCSTFPEDAEIASIDLILIWMALGFLQSPNGKLELEDVGKLQFEELCDRSLLQRSYDDDENDGETLCGLSYSCKMHDLIHDLARSITKSECCIVKPGEEKISDTVSNLRLFVGQNSPAIVQRLKKLRSIHVGRNSPAEKDIIESFLSMCIKQSRYLRVFDLCELSFEVLPSSIGTLKHLRYLDLSDNEGIKRLPDSICKLQSLQTLLLHGCTELEELPRDIRNLVCLRVLSITTKQTHFPEEGIGRLKSLQMLIIVHCNNLGFLPRDLRNCTTLRYLFIISCQQLDLACTDDVVLSLSLQTVLIDALPQATALPQWLKGGSNTLKKLVIRECDNLVALPEWIQDFTSLERLVITNCPEILTLPNGTQHLTSLTHLEIGRCKKLDLASIQDWLVNLKLKKFIIDELPNTTALPSWLRGASKTLEVLKISNCENLASLPEWLSDLAPLQQLEIWQCKGLSAVPEGMERLTSLSKMVITNCNQLKFPPESYKGNRLSLKEVTLRRLGRMTNLPDWLQGASHTLECLSLKGCNNLVALPEWLLDLTSLKRLKIVACPKLSTLPEGMERLTSLSEMEIRNCNRLMFPPESYKGNRLSLKEITLIRLGGMTDMPEWLRGASLTLECLSLWGCDNLVALPEWLPDLTSLKRLVIVDCPELSTLPDGMERLTSLTYLQFTYCSSAFHTRYRRDIGEDWESIAHIPTVNIGPSANDDDTTDEDEKCEGFTGEENIIPSDSSPEPLGV